MKPQDFDPIFIENVCGECSVRAEHLPGHDIAHSQLSFGHVSNMIPRWIHYHVLVRLLKPNHDIHEL